MAIPPPPAGYSMEQSSVPPPPSGYTLEGGTGVPPPPPGYQIEGQHQRSVGEEFTSHVGLGVRNVMRGAASIPDMMINGPVNSIINAVSQGTLSPHGGLSTTPNQDMMDQIADRMHLMRPENAKDRLVGAGIEGATGGLMTSAGGLASQGVKGATGVIGKALASSPLFDTASGASSGLSQQGAAELGADPLTQMAAGLIGGLIPSGVHVAAHVTGHTVAGAPKFIQDMFDSRGVDTTPMPDPRESPLANRGMSTQQQEEYHHVLTHGTADDINNFYANSKIPTPDPAKVEQWVTYRDGVPEGYADPSFHPATEDQLNVGAHNQNLQDHIDQQTAGWKNKPDIELINHVDDIQDPAVREQARKEGAQENAIGFLGTDGKIRMFANRIHTPEQANAVLYHEALGHYGLQEQFGAGLDKTLETLAARNVGSFGTDVKAWMKKNPGAYNGSVARAADEVLAERSGKGPLKPVLMDAIVSHVRRFGRQMGLDLKYNDAEVSHILAMAHDAVINGKGRNVIANQFRGDANKFMYAGKQSETAPAESKNDFMSQAKRSLGLERESGWFKGADDQDRYEISDHNATLKNWDKLEQGKALDFKDENQKANLSEVLHHPELYKAYPELKNVKVTKIPQLFDVWGETQGWFDPRKGELNITPNATDPKSTMLHEIQHWIQNKEGWSNGGSPQSVRLNDMSALGKLEKFYQRRLAETKEKADHYGWTRTDTASSISPIKDKIERLNKLFDTHPTIDAVYKDIYALNRKKIVVELGLKRLRDRFESDYQKALDDYKAKNDERDAKVDAAKAAADKAYKAGDYTQHSERTKDFYKVMKTPRPSYPSRDWDTYEAQRDKFTNKKKELERYIDDKNSEINGIHKPYSDISFDLYKLIAGEREARDVQARQHLGPEERAQTEPYSHENITDDEVIHLNGDGTSHSTNKFMRKDQFSFDDPNYKGDPDYQSHLREHIDKVNSFIEDNRQDLTELQGMMSKPGSYEQEVRDAQFKRIGEIGGRLDAEIKSRFPDINRQEKRLLLRAINKGPYELENYLDRLYNHVDQTGNRFITRQQMDEATSGTYVAKEIDTIYKAMEEDYTPTVKTRAQTIEDAHTLGFSPRQIKALGATPELAVRSARMTQSLNVMDARLKSVRDKVRANEYTPKDLDEARQIIADQMTIGAKIRNERAEYARALAISKLGYTRGQIESFGKLLEEHGGSLAPLGDHETMIRFLKKLDEMHEEGNPNGTAILMKSLTKPNWEDYVTTLHQNFMLSGTSTHFKAPQDMAIGIGRELLESAGALPLWAGNNALRAIGVDAKPGIHPTEVAARLGAIVRTFAEAETYRNSWRTLKEGGVNPNGFGGRQNARIPIISKVTDLISAQDAFFRAFATNMHLYGLGTRQAVEEARAAGGKINWDDVISQGASYARTPSKDLLKEAKLAADKTLLLNKNKLTAGLDRIKNVGPDASGAERFGAFIANFLTPFVRVESNSLVNRIIRRSPLAFLDKETRMDIKAGGARADLAWSRVIYGTAGIASYWMAAGQGKQTGNGPVNPAKKAEMMAAGWRPQAVPENGQYNTGDKLGMSLNPFDVHNQTATMVASMREAFDKDKNEGRLIIGLKMAMYSMMKSMTEMSWINDIAPAVEAATAPDATLGQKADRFAGEELATMVPNIIGQTERIRDQGQPDISDKPFLGPAMSAIPGLRESLPKRMTPYGDEVQGGASLLGTHSWLPQDNRITGGNHVDETTDPAEKEMARLGSLMTGGKALVTKANQHITVEDASGFDPKQVTPKPSGSFGVKLTTRQYSEYQHLVGRNIVEHIRQEMGSPEWQKMTDEEKAEEVKAITDDMKKEVKEHLYGS